MRGRDPDPPFNPNPKTCRKLACGLLLLALPAAAQHLPGVRILSSDEDGESRARLIVGDPGQPPDSGPACLAWSWKEPDAEIEIYPSAEAGSFLGAEQNWSIGDDDSQACHPDGLPAFPEIALGPAGELWFMGDGDGDGWADLLHAVEAAYRQSSPLGEAPLSASSVGTFGGCEIRSVPVDLRTQWDRWLPVELPDTGAEASQELVRLRRFLWWIEPSGEACATAGETATLSLFPLPKSEAEGHLLTVEGVAWTSPEALELDADLWSPRLRHRTPLAKVTDVLLEPTPEQREQPPGDLCAIPGFDQLCAAHTEVRRRLYTAVADPQSETPWPAERIRAVQAACQKVLAGTHGGRRLFDPRSVGCSGKRGRRRFSRRARGERRAQDRRDLARRPPGRKCGVAPRGSAPTHYGGRASSRSVGYRERHGRYVEPASFLVDSTPGPESRLVLPGAFADRVPVVAGGLFPLAPRSETTFDGGADARDRNRRGAPLRTASPEPLPRHLVTGPRRPGRRSRASARRACVRALGGLRPPRPGGPEHIARRGRRKTRRTPSWKEPSWTASRP